MRQPTRPVPMPPGLAEAALLGGSTVGRLDLGWPPRPRSFSLIIPAIPTNGLAQPKGIILAVRFIRPRGVFEPKARVSSRHVPNVGITGTVHNSPVIRLL